MRERQEVGGYRLIKRIGTGGMSSVFEAEDGAGERVALKLMHPAVAAEPSSRERLRREVAMLQRVQGPYVASIIDAETEDSDVFIVTELVDGPTLERDVTDAGVYSGDDLVELGEELGKALRSIHDVDVLHRDLKPSNVMLGLDGPVLIDFGIAQLGDDVRLTEQGSLAHTPGWADPRIIRGDDPDEAADWWALVAVLAFAATGRPPYGKGNPQAIIHRVLQGNVDVAGLADPIAQALRGALCPDLEERLSYDALLDAFRTPETVLAPVSGDSPAAPGSQSRTVDGTMDDDDPARNGVGHDTDVGLTHTFDSEGYASLPPTGYDWDVLEGETDDGGVERTSVYATPPTQLDPEPGPEALPRSYPPTSDIEAMEPTRIDDKPDHTMVLPAMPADTPPNYLPGGAHAAGYDSPVSEQLRPEPWGAPHDYGDARRDVASQTPEWIFLPGTHRVFFFFIWVALSLFGSAIPYWVIIFVGMALVITDSIGASLDDVMSRRIRRGGRQAGEFGRVLLRSPLVLFNGIVKIAISAVFGVGLGALASLALFNLAGVQTRVAVGIGVAIALLMMWIFGTSGKARLGANAVMEAVTPSTGYRVFWIAIAGSVVLGALVFASSGTWVDWSPTGLTL